MKCNKNETCGNLLLNKNLKEKACRSYDGEVMPFLKLPPQNSCVRVTSKAKGPMDLLPLTSRMNFGGGGGNFKNGITSPS